MTENTGRGWLLATAKEKGLFPGETATDGRARQAATNEQLIAALQGAGVTIPQFILGAGDTDTDTGSGGNTTNFPRIPTQGDYKGTMPAMSYPGAIPILPQAAYMYAHGGPKPFPGFTQAWMTPLQEQGFLTQLQGAQHGVGQSLQNQGLAQGLFSGFGNYLGQQGMTATPGYINNISGSFNPWQNPALDDYVQRANQATTRDFMQGVMPQLRARAMGMGQSGSSRHGIAEGLAMQGLADQLGKQTSGLYAQGFDSGMNRYVSDRSNTLQGWLGANRNALQGWNQAPNMFQMTSLANMGAPQALMNLGSQQSQIGSYYQGLANQYLSQQKSLWDQYENRPYRNLEWYSGIVNNNPAAAASAQTSTGPGSNDLANIAGLGLTGLGLWNQFNGGQNPTGWGTIPGSQQSQMLADQWGSSGFSWPSFFGGGGTGGASSLGIF